MLVKKYVEVTANDCKFNAKIDFTNFLNIGVKVLSNSLFGKPYDYGIVINLGGIEYCINFFLDDKKYGFNFDEVGINYEPLVKHLKEGLDLLLNEKCWDVHYWNSKKEFYVVGVAERNEGEDNIMFLKLYLDNFIWHIIHTNPDILHIPTASFELSDDDWDGFLPRDEIKEKKRKNKNKNKKGVKNEQK